MHVTQTILASKEKEKKPSNPEHVKQVFTIYSNTLANYT